MDGAYKRKLKAQAQAHGLKPVVIVGQAGLTETVLAEIEIALDNHELIKVRVRAERDERKEIGQKICTATKAEAIQNIGQIIVIYRQKPKSANHLESRTKPKLNSRVKKNS